MDIRTFLKPFLLVAFLALLYVALPVEHAAQAQEVCYDKNEQIIPCEPKKPVVRKTNTFIPTATQTFTVTPLPTYTATATPRPTVTATALPTLTPALNTEAEPEKPVEEEPGEPIGTNDTDNILERVLNMLRGIWGALSQSIRDILTRSSE